MTAEITHNYNFGDENGQFMSIYCLKDINDLDSKKLLFEGSVTSMTANIFNDITYKSMKIKIRSGAPLVETDCDIVALLIYVTNRDSQYALIYRFENAVTLTTNEKKLTFK